jgi:hypothetical protein
MKIIAENLKNGIVASINATGEIVYKPIHCDKVAATAPGNALVQRHLQRLLDPGWCMTAPRRSDSTVNRNRRSGLWWIAGMLSPLGLVTSYPMAGFVAIVLVLVLLVALVWLIQLLPHGIPKQPKTQTNNPGTSGQTTETCYQPLT